MPFDSLTGASLAGGFCPCAHRQRAVIQRPLFNTGKSCIPTYKLTCGTSAREGQIYAICQAIRTLDICPLSRLLIHRQTMGTPKKSSELLPGTLDLLILRALVPGSMHRYGMPIGVFLYPRATSHRAPRPRPVSLTRPAFFI